MLRTVHEDQARRIKPALGGLPGLPRRGHAGPVLLGGAQRFFEADAVAPEEPARRAVRRGKAMRLGRPHDDLGERQVRLGRHQPRQPGRVRRERRAAAAAPGGRADAARLRVPLGPTDRR
jgi:hypothetical protein